MAATNYRVTYTFEGEPKASAWMTEEDALMEMGHMASRRDAWVFGTLAIEERPAADQGQTLLPTLLGLAITATLFALVGSWVSQAAAMLGGVG